MPRIAAARPLAPIWARLVIAAAAGTLALGIAEPGSAERFLLGAAALAVGVATAAELGRAAPRPRPLVCRAVALFVPSAAAAAVDGLPLVEVVVLPAGLLVGGAWAARTEGRLDRALAVAGGILAVGMAAAALAVAGIPLAEAAFRPGGLGVAAAGAAVGLLGFVAVGIVGSAKPLWDELSRPRRAAASAVLVLLLCAYEAPHFIAAAGTDHSSAARCVRYLWARGVVSGRMNMCGGRRSYEAAAIGSLRTLITAQALFQAGDKDRDGALDYARSLDELIAAGLYMPWPPSPPDAHARFGYRLAVVSDGARWSATALPSCPVCTNGSRSFFVDETGEIRFSTTGPASARSPKIGG